MLSQLLEVSIVFTYACSIMVTRVSRSIEVLPVQVASLINDSYLLKKINNLKWEKLYIFL